MTAQTRGQLDFSIVHPSDLFLQNWVVKILNRNHYGFVVQLCHYRTMERDATHLKWRTKEKFDAPDRFGTNTLSVHDIKLPKALQRHLEEKLQSPVEILKF
jgi:hypothetical protein